MNIFKKNKPERSTNIVPVSRKLVLKGVSVPAFIHNGSYFFTDIDIFEDGVISCWETVDLNLFKKKLGGWVKVSAPDGEDISIHHLTVLKIYGGNWRFDVDSFYDYVVSLIEGLNPGLHNLYKHFERKVNGIVYGRFSTGGVYREEPRYPGEIFPPIVNGDSSHLFYKDSDRYFLIRVSLYADGQIEVFGLHEPFKLTFDNLQTLVKNGIVLTELGPGDVVEISGLGTFRITRQNWAVSIEDKMLELADLIEKLNDRPTSLMICHEAFKEFLTDPTVESRRKLRTAYERIPSHMRMYVGDMDTRDSAVKMAISGEGEIDNDMVEWLRKQSE